MFNLTARNHSDPNNYTNHQLSVVGTWRWLIGARKSLSCQAIINAAETVVKLLQYNATSGVFTEIANLSTSSYNFTGAEVGEDCSIIRLANDSFFRVSSGGGSLMAVHYPYLPYTQAVSASMTYIVSNHSIFKWKSSTAYAAGEFVYVGWLGFYQRFAIESYENRIVITASNATQTSVTGSTTLTYTVTQRVQIMVEASDSVTTLNSYDYSSEGESEPIVPPKCSSQLSNVFIKRTNSATVSVKLFTTYYSS